jgi:predicted small lipoprotein YifL
MKIANIFLAIICLAALAGCGQQNPFPNETPEQKNVRWRSEAKTSMLEEATNRVSGIRNVIYADVENWDQAAVHWRGRVTLDYVNHWGGIDRTNLYFLFGFSSEAFAIEDCDREYAQDIYDITNH